MESLVIVTALIAAGCLIAFFTDFAAKAKYKKQMDEWKTRYDNAHLNLRARR